MSTPDNGNSIFFISRGRYVSVEGPFIETCAQDRPHSLTADMIANRVKRDGLQQHHITFINPFELKDAASTLQITKKAASRIIEHVRAQHGAPHTWEAPIDLGPGRILAAGSAITVFKVIHWPAGQAIRQSLGLGPAFLHVTLGFDPNDIHHYKGPGTLDTLNDRSPCSNQDIERLTSVYTHYRDDTVFLRRLAFQCWKKRYFRWALFLAIRHGIGKLFEHLNVDLMRFPINPTSSISL